MQRPSLSPRVFAVLVLLYLSLGHPIGLVTSHVGASEHRRTPIVIAVERARPAVVDINGLKTSKTGNDAISDGQRRVNGMGTGVIVDSSGYIVTNHHVVDGVRRINVTLSDGRTFQARLVAHDEATDLAIIKIPSNTQLPLIDAGTSSDLMCGETAIAIGNAYGYNGSITCGHISALHRSVEVSDTQHYHDLIQTSAAINPGNSGGPLLNIDGEMIGINVAVRVNAQSIGFAIPVDKVMEVAAQLLSAERTAKVWHGVNGHAVKHQGELVFIVESVEDGSPASKAGLRTGDHIRSIDNKTIENELDLELAFLRRGPGDELVFAVERAGEKDTAALEVTSIANKRNRTGNGFWAMGMRLVPVSNSSLRRWGADYRGGLEIAALQSNSPAAKQGIKRGDVLVGMHQWETVSAENVEYIINRPELKRAGKVKFYVLRGEETLFGFLPVTRR